MRRISSKKIKMLYRYFKENGIITRRPRVIAFLISQQEMYEYVKTGNRVYDEFSQSKKEIILPDTPTSHSSHDVPVGGAACIILKSGNRPTIHSEVVKRFFKQRFDVSKYDHLLMIVEEPPLPEEYMDGWGFEGITNVSKFAEHIHLIHEYCHVIEAETFQVLWPEDMGECFIFGIKILNELPDSFKKSFLKISPGEKGAIHFVVNGKRLV